jgi:hypothetical protein
MIKALPLFIALLLLSLSLSRLPAQSFAGPASGSLEVIATNGAGKERHLSSIAGVVPMLMVRPNQVVPVTLQFPAAMAGTQLAAVPLDGGRVGGGNLVVLPTGRTLFTFSPGAMPGRYRVMVYVPGEQYLLEFYVVDPNNPPFQKRPRGVQ